MIYRYFYLRVKYGLIRPPALVNLKVQTIKFEHSKTRQRWGRFTENIVMYRSGIILFLKKYKTIIVNYKINV